MFKRICLLALLVPSATAASAGESGQSPEQRLQAVLQGYEPGPPQRCLATSRIRKFKIVEGAALTASVGGQVFVNRPVNAAALREDLIPVIEPDAGRLCSGAPVALRTSADFFNVAAVRLQDWVPYRRIGK
ncbi:MAG: hypothetical protein RL339_1005 [Pseudomonadota bacterium]|jgi:hypothetical protein